jgi:hypothetical protein
MYRLAALMIGGMALLTLSGCAEKSVDGEGLSVYARTLYEHFIYLAAGSLIVLAVILQVPEELFKIPYSRQSVLVLGGTVLGVWGYVVVPDRVVVGPNHFSALDYRPGAVVPTYLELSYGEMTTISEDVVWVRRRRYSSVTEPVPQSTVTCAMANGDTLRVGGDALAAAKWEIFARARAAGVRIITADHARPPGFR